MSTEVQKTENRRCLFDLMREPEVRFSFQYTITNDKWRDHPCCKVASTIFNVKSFVPERSVEKRNMRACYKILQSHGLCPSIGLTVYVLLNIIFLNKIWNSKIFNLKFLDFEIYKKFWSSLIEYKNKNFNVSILKLFEVNLQNWK